MRVIKGTNLRVAHPDEMVECITEGYATIKKGAVFRVVCAQPSHKPDSDWSYRLAGMQGIYKGCNFRRMEDKFNPDYGGKIDNTCYDQKEGKNVEEDDCKQLPEIRIYFWQCGRIVHRILQRMDETAEEFLARGDEFIRKHPTAEAHVYRKIALRRTSPAPIENIAL